MKIRDTTILALSAALLTACGGGGGGGGGGSSAPSGNGNSPADDTQMHMPSPTLQQDIIDRAATTGPYLPFAGNDLPGLHVVDVSTGTSYQVTDFAYGVGPYVPSVPNMASSPVVAAEDLMPTHFIFGQTDGLYAQDLRAGSGSSLPQLITDRRVGLNADQSKAVYVDHADVNNTVIPVRDSETQQHGFVRLNGEDFTLFEDDFKIFSATRDMNGAVDQLYLIQPERSQFNLHIQNIDGTNREQLLGPFSEQNATIFADRMFIAISGGSGIWNLHRVTGRTVELIGSYDSNTIDNCNLSLPQVVEDENAAWFSVCNTLYFLPHLHDTPFDFATPPNSIQRLSIASMDEHIAVLYQDTNVDTQFAVIHKQTTQQTDHDVPHRFDVKTNAIESIVHFSLDSAPLQVRSADGMVEYDDMPNNFLDPVFQTVLLDGQVRPETIISYYNNAAGGIIQYYSAAMRSAPNYETYGDSRRHNYRTGLFQKQGRLSLVGGNYSILRSEAAFTTDPAQGTQLHLVNANDRENPQVIQHNSGW